MYYDDSMGLLFGIMILVSLIQVVLAVFVYRDAEKRGKSGVLWAIMVFFFGIIVFIVWLIVRPPKQVGNSQNVVNVYPQQPYPHMYDPPPEAPADKKH